MIVVDASAVVEALVGRSPAPELLDLLEGDLAAPHVIDIEMLSALRGLVLGGHLRVEEAEEAREVYAQLTIARYEATLLADRIWALRHQYTSYDAAYLALAEGIDAPVVTCDRKLDAGGHRASVTILPRSC